MVHDSRRSAHEAEIRDLMRKALGVLSDDECRALLLYLCDAADALDRELAARAPGYDTIALPALSCRACGSTSGLSHFYPGVYSRSVDGALHVSEERGSWEDGPLHRRSFLFCDACGRNTTIPAATSREVDFG